MSLAKCWQSSRGSIVFQCSLFDGEKRLKGYLELNSDRASAPVTFSGEKPESLLPAGGIAMLIRKHLSVGALTGIAMSDAVPDLEFFRIRAQGKNSDGVPSQLFFILSRKPDHEITIIRENLSIARLKADAQYTVAKPASTDFLHVEDFPETGLQAWLTSLIEPEAKTNQTTQASVAVETLPLYQRAGRDRVTRRLKTLRKTLLQDREKVPSQEELQNAKEDAKLLRDYLWLVRSEAFELALDDTQTGSIARVIKLNPDLTPGANLEAAFTKVRKLERALSMGGPRIQDMERSIKRFESALDRLRSNAGLSETDVIRVLQELGLERRPEQKAATAKSTKPASAIGRTFLTATGEIMALGRNAEESDRLVKSAKSQDWWIHVAGGSHGSHVIIPGKTFKDGLPGHVLREAGILALHFSDRGTSREGDVYVARRHQIKKRKGMPAGLWQIDRAETMVIRYEADELSAIFAREIRDGVQRPHAAKTQS